MYFCIDPSSFKMFSFCLVVSIGIYFVMSATLVLKPKCSVILFNSWGCKWDRILSNGKKLQRKKYILSQINMSNTLTLVCLNYRGLRERHKKQAVFTFLKNKVLGIFLWQKTHFDISSKQMWNEEW